MYTKNPTLGGRDDSGFRSYAPVFFFASLLFLASGPASAVWGSGFFQCKRTALVDFPGTITEAAIATPELSTLTELVVAAGLADDLADETQQFTVFAPVNTAFANLPSYLVDGLLTPDANGELTDLTAVLLYHVKSRRFDPRRVVYIREIDTLAGQSLFVNRTGSGPRVNQSNIDCQGVRATNGIVWFIDSVLLPQF